MEITLHPSTDQSDAHNDPIHDENEILSTEAARITTEFSNVTRTTERWVNLQFTWAGKPFSLDVADSDRVYDLKAALHDLTKADLKLVPGKKFTLLGTPEGNEMKDPSKLENLPDVINDFDVDVAKDPAARAKYQTDQRNIRKVKEMTEKLNINIIHPLREGKKLAVLDIDYTILDTKPLTSGSLPPAECARPGLHEFLEAIYPYYDSFAYAHTLRSQTSWVWLETKLVELEMIGANRNYQISFGDDTRTSMFTVFTERDGKPWQHHVKALQIVWNHFPQLSAKNTIHVDDLGRNFALNPQSGLKIHAFKNAHTPEAQADRELSKLKRYMLHIAPLGDLRSLTHSDWKTVVRNLPRS
ncbi:hypothetical protein D9757_006525 [Collybiopsis confluens]|uniref:FCP1 homology domain-containing protein n=1 Tax=Collybiopsis confluens TaxID=2823264 RepID=A0A8H5HQ82_9AGAR|nr:hypothetical protein D9757_006525 [Collybiopsis confluens]